LAGFVFGAGMGTLYPALQTLTIKSAPVEKKTAASAVALNAYDIGLCFGTVLMGFIAGWLGTYRSVFAFNLIFIFLLLLGYLVHPSFKEGRTVKREKD
jgi:MFS family permease